MSALIIKHKEDERLYIQTEAHHLLFKANEEEIWKDEKLLASYEDIAGIAVKEQEGGLYKMEISFEETETLIVAQKVEDAQMQELVTAIWGFLGLGMEEE